MKSLAWLKKLRCPQCRHPALKPLPFKRGNWGAWGVPGLRCPQCGESYPVVEGGVLRMIPKGDYKRYAHWEKLHSEYTPEFVTEMYRRDYGFPERFQLTFFAMPRLARKLGWKAKDSLELGSGWGRYSLSLQRFGVVEQPWLLDISVRALKGALEVYQAFGSKAYAVQGEIHSLPFQDQAFDLSLSGGLYEHFVGEEQQALVAENCRVSRRVLCQVPESSLAYWIYRKLVTWKLGKWPFGFETPLSRRRLAELYTRAGSRLVGWDYHNLASAAVFSQARRWPWLSKLMAFRPFFFYCFRHDALLGVETQASRRGHER